MVKHTAAWVDESEQAMGGSEGLARGLEAEVNGKQAASHLPSRLQSVGQINFAYLARLERLNLMLLCRSSLL